MLFPLVKLFVSGFGVGLLPKAPGTWGSLLALFLFWWIPAPSLPFILIALFVMGWAGTSLYMKTTKTQDPQEVVIDEIIGQGICLLWIPHTLAWWAVAFVLFRFFDIKKPFPVSWADQLKGPFAVLLDDIIAGLIASLLMALYQQTIFLEGIFGHP